MEGAGPDGRDEPAVGDVRTDDASVAKDRSPAVVAADAPAEAPANAPAVVAAVVPGADPSGPPVAIGPRGPAGPTGVADAEVAHGGVKGAVACGSPAAASWAAGWWSVEAAGGHGESPGAVGSGGNAPSGEVVPAGEDDVLGDVEPSSEDGPSDEDAPSGEVAPPGKDGVSGEAEPAGEGAVPSEAAPPCESLRGGDVDDELPDDASRSPR